MAGDTQRPDETVSIYVTIGSEADAKTLARALLERRLIACANLWPIQSLYEWEGKLAEEAEVAMWCKTTRDRVAPLLHEIPKLHPYELPCIEVFPAEASPPFAGWVQKQTRASA